MKSAILCLVAYFASATALDASYASSLHDTLQNEVSKSLRGRKSPLEMNEEERDRETRFICSIINTAIPGAIECTCTNAILQGKIGFDCSASEPRCIGVDAGGLCAASSVKGEIELALLQLSAGLRLEACAGQASANTTLTPVQIPLGNVCFKVAAKAGLSGVGITECSASILGYECAACGSCVTNNNSTGIGVECDGLPINVCLPINIPVFTDRLNPELSLSEVADPAVWESVSTELAIEVAQYEIKEANRRKLASN